MVKHSAETSLINPKELSNTLDYSTDFVAFTPPLGKPKTVIYDLFRMDKPYIVLSWMMVFTSVYFSSQALQCSKWISSTSHNGINTHSYAYNLLFVWLVTYSLFTFSNIIAITKPNILLYWIFSTFGGLGFALLGEIPALKNFAITKGWLHRLPPFAIVTIVFFTILILILAYKEYKTLKANRQICKEIGKLGLIALIYYIVYIILAVNKAKSIHYHVHHAIFSGVLSLWFIDWDSVVEMVTHAILMGIVIEGIDFYGIQELFLFLAGNNSVTFFTSLFIAFVYLIPASLGIYYFYYKKF